MSADEAAQAHENREAADGIRGTAHGTAPVPLSVLDLVTVGAGRTATDALRTSVELSRRTEARGFHRYWVAEHHSMPGVASSSPAVILAHLAAHTERIRLGSGGVMLPNHAPLVIAEQFGTLEALAPHRIDLGLGRAPGTDGATAAALRRSDTLNEGADDFPEQLAELIRFLDDDFPDGHPYRRIHAIPGPVQGSAPGGGPVRAPPAGLAARLLRLQRPAGRNARPAVRLRPPLLGAEHRPRAGPVPPDLPPLPVLAEPYALIGVSALATDEEREARRQTRAMALNMLRLRMGRPGLFPDPAEAEQAELGAMEEEFIASWSANVVHGTPDEVRSGLNDLHKRTGADELMITTHAHRGEVRVRSYELIADAYELPTAG